MLKRIARLLFSPLSYHVNRVLDKRKIFVIWRPGKSIGDQVLITWAVNELYEAHGLKAIIFSPYPSLFVNNRQILKVYDLSMYRGFVSRLLEFSLNLSLGSNVERFCFEKASHSNSIPKYMVATQRSTHLAKLHVLHWKRRINSPPKAYFYLSSDEKNRVLDKFNLTDGSYSIINTDTKLTYTPVKGWSSDKFQEVVNASREMNWVQIGLNRGQTLTGVQDLIGRTTLREVVILISCCKTTLSTEGMVNHIASGFERVGSVVVMSGFCPTDHVFYKNSIFVYSNKEIPCRPCWLVEPCPNNKICTNDISPGQVLDAIRCLS